MHATTVLPPQVCYLPVCTYNGAEYVTETPLAPRTFADIVRDTWDGQIEHLSRLWCVDLTAGTATDETARLARALAEQSFDTQTAPYPALAQWLENQFLDFYRDDDSEPSCNHNRQYGTLNHTMQGTGR